jgi:hypothetical protein
MGEIQICKYCKHWETIGVMTSAYVARSANGIGICHRIISRGRTRDEAAIILEANEIRKNAIIYAENESGVLVTKNTFGCKAFDWTRIGFAMAAEGV